MKLLTTSCDEVILYKGCLGNNFYETYKFIQENSNEEEFNFDTIIPGMGYTRTFSECFEIDSNGYFGESVLITEYILKNIDEKILISPQYYINNIPGSEDDCKLRKSLAEKIVLQ